MIELCGARARARDDRHRRPRPAAADDPAARRARRRRCSGVAIPRERCSGDPRGARVHDRRRARRARRRPSRLPPRRRHPRGRPDRGGRAARRAREAARDAALAARRVGPADAAPAAAPPRRRRADRPGSRTRSSAGASPGPTWRSELRLRPTAAGGRARRTRCRPSSRSCARRCSARCSTSRSRNRARGADALRLFEAGAVYLPDGRRALPARALPRRRAARAGPVRPADVARRRRRREADFFAAKGVLAGLLDGAAASTGGVEATAEPSRSCIPGRAARIMLGGERGRLARRDPPAGRGRVGPAARPIAGFELDLDAVARARPDRPLRGPDELPRGARGPRGDRRRGASPRPTCSRSCAQAGAPLLADAEVFDVYRDASGSAPATSRSRCGSPTGRPTGR